MTYGERWESGMQMAAKSVRMVQKNPVLIAYGIVAGLAPLILMFSLGFGQDPFKSFLLYAVFAAAWVTVNIFFKACIVWHSSQLLHHRVMVTARETIHACWAKKSKILMWGALSLVSVISVVGNIWSVIMFFVLPIIVLEELSILAAIKRSWAMVKEQWFEIISGIIGVALRTFILGVIWLGLYVLVGRQLIPGQSDFLSMIGVAIVALSFLAASGYITAAYCVLATDMYYQYYKTQESSFEAFKNISM